MPSQYTISQLIDVFKPVYRTIELRVGLIRTEADWKLGAVAMRLCVDGPDVVKRGFQRLQKRYGRLDSKRLSVRQYCYAFSEIDRMMQGVLEGHLTLKRLKLRCDSGINVLSSRGRVEYQFPPHIPRYVSLKWPVLTTQVKLSSGDDLQAALRDNFQVVRDCELAGYSDGHSAIRHLLEIDFGPASSGTWLWLLCDVPARIASVEARRKTGNWIALDVAVKAAPSVSALQCNIRHTKNRNNEEPWLQGPIALRAKKVGGGGKTLSGTFRLDMNIDDRVDVELIHKRLGRLYSRRFHLRELLRVEERNPLFATLTRFCSPSQLKDLLERPDIAKTPQNVSFKGGGRIYEISVQWLLTMLGFEAVWLHGFETLRTPEYDYGSIDCLAYHEERKVLLLVNATTAPPNQHELNRQRELQLLLKREVFNKAKIRLLSVVFSATSKSVAVDRFYGDSTVRIIYREDIAEILQLIAAGREIEYVDRIISH